jgi:predicted lipoprotein with Yx(FWY)xxD motif
VITISRIAAVTSLIMTAGLAGCSFGSYESGQNAGDAGSKTYGQALEDYSEAFSSDTSIGRVLATPEGMTVYTFDLDQGGDSECYDSCARQWPPVLASSDAQPHGRMSLTQRDDGQRQWKYDDQPLYTFIQDTKAGDVNGDNVGNVWHVVR